MNIFIVIATIVVLIVLHELGHFIFAKKYGVRVDEFGVGIPPRLFGKKIGETIYSINLIPLGGFVKLHGEDAAEDDEKSFSQKPIYQRAVILFAGVAAFFVVAAIIFSIISYTGVRTAVADDFVADDAQIIITQVAPESPADEAGMRMGDVIKKVNGEEVSKAQETISLLDAEEVNLLLLRGEKEISVSVIPRSEHPEKEGPLGIGLIRTVDKSYPLYAAPFQGTVMMAQMTGAVVHGFYTALSSVVTGKPLPDGMEIGGPVRIVEMGSQTIDRGVYDYLYFVALISISLAVINILPIPALDGGRLFFLGIEKVKGSPIPQKLEQGMNVFFFLALITLMLFVTFKDIQGLI